MTTTLHLNDANQLIGESYSSGMFGSLAMTNTFDTFLRRTSLSARKDTSTLANAAFGYDTAGRLSTVTDGAWKSTYAHLANSPLAPSWCRLSNRFVINRIPISITITKRLTGCL